MKNNTQTVNEPKSIVKLKLDIIFKMLFGNPEHSNILKAFLSAALNVPAESIRNIVFENAEVLPDAVSDKFARLDVRLQIDGKRINIEIQICYEADYADRTLFYWAKTFTAKLKKR